MNDTPHQHAHYYDRSPATPRDEHEFTLATPRGPLTMRTAGGVFSSRDLDKGTAVLLSTLADHPELWPATDSQVCDLGCGAGPIALWLATVTPDCRVDAVDVNERAVAICAANAARLGLSNIQATTPEAVPPERRYDLIVSNPPIRIGKSALHDLLSTWLSRLTDTGSAILVVSKNLGSDSLAQWMMTNSYEVTKLSSKKGFRVLRVARQHPC